jgi:hypothetical protein
LLFRQDGRAKSILSGHTSSSPSKPKCSVLCSKKFYLKLIVSLQKSAVNGLVWLGSRGDRLLGRLLTMR